MKRHIAGTFAILAASAVAAASAAEPDSVAVESVAVESVVLRLIDEANAPARDAGVVTEITVREGQAVRRGDTLAVLDDAQARIAEQAATVNETIAKEKSANDVNVRSAKAAREAAAAELRRSEESIAKFARSVSQSQLDVERLRVKQMTLELEQAEQEQQLASLDLRLRQTELEAARLKLKHRQIVAPIDGVVVEVTTRLGEWLEPGQKAMRLVNASRLKAEGFVSAEDATRLTAGQTVKLTVGAASDDGTFAGRLDFVSPEVDPINDQVRVWAEIDNARRRLRPGQRVAMTVDVESQPTEQTASAER